MKELSQKSRSTPSTSELSRKSTGKFMPNLKQLQAAIQELPDPEASKERHYQCAVEVQGRMRHIKFKRIEVARGRKDVQRWIYEGKLLIRNQDSDAQGNPKRSTS